MFVMQGSYRLVAVSIIRYTHTLRRLAFASLDLKKPYRRINSDAQWAASLFKLFDGELGERYACARADFLVDSACISTGIYTIICATHPWIPISTPCYVL